MPRGKAGDSNPGTPIVVPPVTRILRSRRIISSDDENLRPGTPADLQEPNATTTAPDGLNTPSKTPGNRRSTRRTSISEDLRTPVKSASSPLRRSTRSSSIASDDRGPSTPNLRSKQKPLTTSPILEVTEEISEISTQRRVTRNNSKSSSDTSKTSPVLSTYFEEQLNSSNENEMKNNQEGKKENDDDKPNIITNKEKIDNSSRRQSISDKNNSGSNSSISDNTSLQSKLVETLSEKDNENNVIEISKKDESKKDNCSTPGRNDEKIENKDLFTEDKELTSTNDKNGNDKATENEEIPSEKKISKEESISKNKYINISRDTSLMNQTFETDRSKKFKSVVFDEQSILLSEEEKSRYPKTPISKDRSSGESFFQSKLTIPILTQSNTVEISKNIEKPLAIAEKLKAYENIIDLRTPDRTLIGAKMSSSTPITFDPANDVEKKLINIGINNSEKKNASSTSNSTQDAEKVEEKSTNGNEIVFGKSWSQPVTGSAVEIGKQSFIDGFSLFNQNKDNKKINNDNEETEDEQEDLEKQNSNVKKYLLVNDSSSSEQEETEVNKNEFVDDEAMEVDNSNEDSLSSKEREYLKMNEIPERGESIGSKDSELASEDDSYQKNSFIASSYDEDVEEAEEEEVVSISDSISEGEKLTNYSDTSEEEARKQNKSVMKEECKETSPKNNETPLENKNEPIKKCQLNVSVKENSLSEMSEENLTKNVKDNETDIEANISLGGSNEDNKEKEKTNSPLKINNKENPEEKEPNELELNSFTESTSRNSSLTGNLGSHNSIHSTSNDNIFQGSFASNSEKKRQKVSNLNKSRIMDSNSLDSEDVFAKNTPKKYKGDEAGNKTPNTSTRPDQSSVFGLADIFEEEEEDNIVGKRSSILNESKVNDRNNSSELTHPLLSKSQSLTPESTSNSLRYLSAEKSSSVKKRKRSLIQEENTILPTLEVNKNDTINSQNRCEPAGAEKDDENNLNEIQEQVESDTSTIDDKEQNNTHTTVIRKGKKNLLSQSLNIERTDGTISSPETKDRRSLRYSARNSIGNMTTDDEKSIKMFKCENSEKNDYEKTEKKENQFIGEKRIILKENKPKSISQEYDTEMKTDNEENGGIGNDDNNDVKSSEENEETKKRKQFKIVTAGPYKDLLSFSPVTVLGRCEKFLEDLNKKKKEDKTGKKKESKIKNKSKNRLKQDDNSPPRDNNNFRDENKEKQLTKALHHAQIVLKEKAKLLKRRGQKEKDLDLKSNENLQVTSENVIVKHLKKKPSDAETATEDYMEENSKRSRKRTIKENSSFDDSDTGTHNPNGNLLLQNLKNKIKTDKSVMKMKKVEEDLSGENNNCNNEYSKSKPLKEKLKTKHKRKFPSSETLDNLTVTESAIKKDIAIITHKSGLWIEENVETSTKEKNTDNKSCLKKKNKQKLLTFPWGEVHEEPLTPKKRVAINGFEETEITPLPKKMRKNLLPKKSKILQIVNTPSGKFYEENLTQKKNSMDVFEESDLTPLSKKSSNKSDDGGKSLKNMHSDNGKKSTKLISSMAEPLLFSTSSLKRDKKRKEKYILKEPTGVLPKPKWLSSSSDRSKGYEGGNLDISNDENYLAFEKVKRMKSSHRPISVSESTGNTDFLVKPLNLKKKQKGIKNVDVSQEGMWSEAALKFKANAIYNNSTVKRESSKELLRRKEKKKISKLY